MFQTDDKKALRRQTDTFNVPMFLVEPAENANFRLLAINAAHERVSGMRNSVSAGALIDEILAPAQAAAVTQRYQACLSGQSQKRYVEELDLPFGRMRWDTTIRFFETETGRPRILGSAICAKVSDSSAEQLAFDDVRYYASGATLKLDEVVEVLESIGAGDLQPHGLERSARLLATICRSVTSSLQDIRDITEGQAASDLNEAGALLNASAGAENDVALRGVQRASENLLSIMRQASKRRIDPTLPRGPRGEQATSVN